MTKKHFIALADQIKSYNRFASQDVRPVFGPDHLELLADFCASVNYNFNRERWLSYIAGKCGPSGGKVSPSVDSTLRGGGAVAPE